MSDAGVAAAGHSPDDADLGASERAGARVVWLTATAFCGIWIVGLIPAVTSPGGGMREPLVGLVLLVVVALAWAACLLMRRVSPRLFVAILALSVVILAATTEPTSLAGPYAALVPFVNLAALMAAMLLPVREAVCWIVGIALAAMVVVLVSAVISAELWVAWRGCLLMAAYPIAVGIAALSTVWTLLDVAAADDSATQERLHTIARVERERAGVAERFQISRLLHDTVVNTFGAVREGLSDPALIRERSSFDLQALGSRATQQTSQQQPGAVSPQTSGALTAIIQSAQARARTLGLTLTVVFEGTKTDVPSAVAAEVGAAVGEALVNISKHSGTDRADLRLTSTSGGFEIRVGDRGHGFATTTTPRSIALRCGAVGVNSSARPRPGGGAEIVMTWQRPNADQQSQIAPSSVLFSSLIPATRRFSICLLTLFVINTVLVIGEQSVTWSAVALILIAAAVATAIATAARGIPIPWYASLFLAVSALLVVYLPTVGVAGCQAIGIGWWGALGSSMCVVVIVLLSGKAQWIIAGCMGYSIGMGLIIAGLGPDSMSCVVESMPAIVFTDIAFVGALIAFRRMLTRYGTRAEESKLATEEAIARTAAIREHERIRSVILESVIAEVQPLLGELADGSLDPTDPRVRKRCSDEEVYLRALVKIDPDLGALGDAMTLCVQLAHSRGASLSVQCAEKVVEPSSAQLDAIQQILHTTVETLPVGAEAWVTLFREPNAASMTIVAPATDRNLGAPAGAELINKFRVDEETEGDQVLVELSWST